MNKIEFVRYIASKHSITQQEASAIIDTFTNSVISLLGEGKEVRLVGFGNYLVSEVPARAGLNPRTGEKLQIKSYKQPRFKAGQKMKDAVNK